MSGRFAGSRSLDERRRRRLAVDEGVSEKKLLPSDGETVRPLPVRRPTARFPLGRIVPRLQWKLALASIVVAALCGGIVAASQSSAVREGAFGPGVSDLFSESGRLAPACGGLLLILVGQFALLIRWARARSFRDFHGRYRIWWWTAIAAIATGVSVLTDAHVALAATLTWALPHLPAGLKTYVQLVPALGAILLLTPSLQRESRGCNTSRSLIIIASSLYLSGLLAIAAEASLAPVLTQVGVAISARGVQQGLLLAGTAAAFSGMLFHARHVIYESAEPPEAPASTKKKTKKKVDDAVLNADVDPAIDVKPKRVASRRSKRTAAEAEAEVPVAKESNDEEPSKPIRKPHFTQAAEQTSKSESKATSKNVTGGKEVAAPIIEMPTSTAKAVPTPAKQAIPEPQHESDSDGEEDGMVEINGRLLRLDGPEEALKGLSKRDRRKLRQALKERERNAA